MWILINPEHVSWVAGVMGGGLWELVAPPALLLSGCLVFIILLVALATMVVKLNIERASASHLRLELAAVASGLSHDITDAQVQVRSLTDALADERQGREMADNQARAAIIAMMERSGGGKKSSPRAGSGNGDSGSDSLFSRLREQASDSARMLFEKGEPGGPDKQSGQQQETQLEQTSCQDCARQFGITCRRHLCALCHTPNFCSSCAPERPQLDGQGKPRLCLRCYVLCMDRHHHHKRLEAEAYAQAAMEEAAAARGAALAAQKATEQAEAALKECLTQLVIDLEQPHHGDVPEPAAPHSDDVAKDVLGGSEQQHGSGRQGQQQHNEAALRVALAAIEAATEQCLQQQQQQQNMSACGADADTGGGGHRARVRRTMWQVLTIGLLRPVVPVEVGPSLRSLHSPGRG